VNVRRSLRRSSGAGTLFAGALASVLLAGCGSQEGQGSPASAAEARTPHHLVFVYDRSTSITTQELSVYRSLTEQSLEFLDHGDRIAAVELLQLSLSEAPDRWGEQVPVKEFAELGLQRDSVSRVRFLRDARDYLRRYTDPEDRDGYLGTDILSTMFDVAEETRAFPGHETTVVIFSDMLQAAEEINMEGMMRMPPADWVERRKAEGRLPDLSGVCIVVVGARTDTADGQRVKGFWQDYFDATGAILLDRNYSLRPVRLPEDACAGAR